VTDFGALRAEWAVRAARQGDLGTALGFWTPIIDGWARWPADAVSPLGPLSWSPADCADRWKRGVPLVVEAKPELPRDPIEELIGPLIERLAVAGPDEMAGLRRFAEAWDAGALGPIDLFPTGGWGALSGPFAAGVQERLGVPASIAAFLAHAGLRPALETYFSLVRFAPDGVWPSAPCPWCGGPAAYAEVAADGRRRHACHLCGGAWPAAPGCCPFCERRQPDVLVPLLADEVDSGHFVEGCRHCHGYLKGIDRRGRAQSAGSALVEDWGSPQLDLRAAEQGYRRATPSLAHLVQ